MEDSGEVDVLDFVRLMRDYLENRIDADQYKRGIFSFSRKRVNVPAGEADRITQQAYGDADDYDPLVMLPYTIEEPELRARVAKSLSELAALGYVSELES